MVYARCRISCNLEYLTMSGTPVWVYTLESAKNQILFLILLNIFLRSFKWGEKQLK